MPENLFEFQISDFSQLCGLGAIHGVGKKIWKKNEGNGRSKWQSNALEAKNSGPHKTMVGWLDDTEQGGLCMVGPAHEICSLAKEASEERRKKREIKH